MAAYKYKLIDMFSGMGCASLGFRNAGFEIAAALEIDPTRCSIYEENLGIRPIQKDVMLTNGKEIMRHAGIRGNKRFCIVGCPPCQSFSKLADTTSVDTINDPRSRYIKKFAAIVEAARPAAAVFENVAWMARGPGRAFFDHYLQRMENAGYHTVYGVVNAADYGVPQNRHRVIAISLRKRLMSARARSSLDEFLHVKKRRYKTVRDAIGDLKPIGAGRTDSADSLHFSTGHTPRVLEMIRAVPKDGGGRKQIPKRLWLDCHKRLSDGAETVYGRMWWDRPAPTMTCRCTTPACGRFIHPAQNRGITIREAMRIQTIPDGFRMSGSRSAAEEMIGDAVPVLLAKRIGQKLLDVLS